MHRLVTCLAIVAAIAVGGCGMLQVPRDPNALVPWPQVVPADAAPWPDPPRPDPIPPRMKQAIEVAHLTADELSFSGMALMRTAFLFDLTTVPCGPLDEWCRGRTGPAWGVVFEMTNGQGLPMRTLVILDMQEAVLNVDGWDYPTPDEPGPTGAAEG